MTTAYVATLGGHVTELAQLAPRISSDGEVWITNDSPQTRALLEGRTVEMVPFVGERDYTGVLRAVPTARRLYREYDVTRVVSTGSALALGYLPVASCLGLEAHFIESATRVSSCSLTGRLLRPVPGVRCWWQYPSPPAGFRHAGNVYDGFETSPQQPKKALDRVVVTVGTTERDFRRLIAPLTEIIPRETEVLWQTGHTDVSGLGIEAHELVPEPDLVRAMEQADVVISHAGAGSLLLALRAGRVPVFVPRRAAYGEQIDDHQVELANWARDRGLAVSVEAHRVELNHLMCAANQAVVTTPARHLDLR